MIRIVGFGSGMKGIEIEELDEEEMGNIEDLVVGGEPVIICDHLADLERLGVDRDDVEML